MRSCKLFCFSMISSGLMIICAFLQWSIVDIITPFLMAYLWIGLAGFFLLVTVIALLALFKHRVWMPLMVQLATILLLVFFPFTDVVLDMNFKINKAAREEVVIMVKNGTLKPNVSYNSSLILLPDKYRRLSKGGGQVVIEKNSDNYVVFFYTFRGVLDNFSGFVYSSNNEKPNQEDLVGDLQQIKKLDENWYYIESY